MLTKQSNGAESLWKEAHTKLIMYLKSGDSDDMQDIKGMVEGLDKETRSMSHVGTEDIDIFLDASQHLDICSLLLHDVQDLQKGNMETKTSKILDQIASAVQDFVQIGDIVVQADPLHAGLPWAGFRLILVVCSLTISLLSCKTFLLRFLACHTLSRHHIVYI